MNKKKAVKLGIITGIIVLLGIIGVLGVQKMTEPTEKEKQITFLKEHEDEMTEYIKKDSEYVKLKKYNVDRIVFNWNSVIEIQSMAFSEKKLSIEVELFNKDHNNLDGFEIYITPDDLSNPKKIELIE
ncbi:hypothetical protein [Enterococcus sp. AZ177]|uniref:hypothetical protein n=1 Tax=unclassified Enterococcus TaxID=2608891 RepID=UPI003D2FDE43